MKLSINHRVFNYITNSPHCIKTANITVLYKPYNNSCLGFIVPKSLGPAYLRNQFKRRCRYAFQTSCLNQNLEPVGVIVRPTSIDIAYLNIRGVFNKLNSKILDMKL